MFYNPTHPMRPARILRALAFTLLTLLLVLFAFIQIQQRLLRRRAERLHAEILALQLHPGTFADIQRLQNEWGRQAHYEGECTPHHCIYEISLLDVASEIDIQSDWLQYHWMVRHLLLQPYSWLGGKYENVLAEVRVRNDVMWGADFSLFITEETHHLDPWNKVTPTVAVQIRFGPRLFSFYPPYSASGLRRGYTFGVLRGFSAHINLTPRIAADWIRELNGIDFACMTRYRPCSTLAQLIPKQWNTYSAELARKNVIPQANYAADFDDCSPPLSLLALEARNIALVEYLGKGIRRQEVTGSAGTYDLLRPMSYLKNGFAEQEARVNELAIPYYPPDSFGAQPGQRFIVFYSRESDDPTRPSIRECAIFPDTPENEREILKGVAMDPSVGEPYSWTG